MHWRTVLVIVVSMIVSSVLIFAVSCDSAKKHELLTFFFDDVPPLNASTEQSVARVSDVNAQGKEGLEVSKPSVFIHEPYSNCSEECHSQGKKKDSFWGAGTVRLKAEVPELCYKCHDKHSAEEGRIHGPVASGACIFCHNPHRSRNENLLKDKIPELCYKCHEKESINLIAEHSKELYFQCNDCHDSHVSSTKGLLKEDRKKRLVEKTVD